MSKSLQKAQELANDGESQNENSQVTAEAVYSRMKWALDNINNVCTANPQSWRRDWSTTDAINSAKLFLADASTGKSKRKL